MTVVENPPPRVEWPQFLTPLEVAEVLRVHVRTVYRMIEAGELAAVRVGAGPSGKWQYRVYEDAFAAYLLGARVVPEVTPESPA